MDDHKAKQPSVEEIPEPIVTDQQRLQNFLNRTSRKHTELPAHELEILENLYCSEEGLHQTLNWNLPLLLQLLNYLGRSDILVIQAATNISQGLELLPEDYQSFIIHFWNNRQTELSTTDRKKLRTFLKIPYTPPQDPVLETIIMSTYPWMPAAITLAAYVTQASLSRLWQTWEQRQKQENKLTPGEGEEYINRLTTSIRTTATKLQELEGKADRHNPYATLSTLPDFSIQRNLPPPVENDGNVALISAPSGDKWLEPSRPTLFNDDRKMWKPWKFSVLSYVAINKDRFRTSYLHVLSDIRNFTKIESRARRTIDRFLSSINIEGTTENIEFKKLAGNVQAANWLLDYMNPFYIDLVTPSQNIGKLRRNQRETPLIDWLQELQDYQLELDLSTETIMTYVLSGINKKLLFNIGLKLNKTSTQINWQDLWTQGPIVESEMNEMMQQRAPRVPLKFADPRPSGSETDHQKQIFKQLPATCNDHSDRKGCPANLKGKLGEWGSASRESKIAELRELNRCFVCRGKLSGSPGSSRNSTPA